MVLFTYLWLFYLIPVVGIYTYKVTHYIMHIIDNTVGRLRANNTYAGLTLL